jgi:hypothetical protein
MIIYFNKKNKQSLFESSLRQEKQHIHESWYIWSQATKPMSQNIQGCEFKLNLVEKTLNLTDPKKVTGYQTSYI